MLPRPGITEQLSLNDQTRRRLLGDEGVSREGDDVLSYMLHELIGLQDGQIGCADKTTRKGVTG